MTVLLIGHFQSLFMLDRSAGHKADLELLTDLKTRIDSGLINASTRLKKNGKEISITKTDVEQDFKKYLIKIPGKQYEYWVRDH